MKYAQKAKVWLYPGAAAWHFITIPKNTSEKIRKKYAARTRGWGSLRVRVSLGESEWDTSIFPDKKSGTFLLPLKASIRKKEEVLEGETVSFTLAIL